MFSTFGERIRQIREKRGLNQKDFAKEIGINQGHISNLEKNLKKPSKLLIKFVCYKFDIREEWLINGNGPMSRRQVAQNDKTIVEAQHANLEKGKKSIDPFLEYIDERLTDLEKEDPEIRPWFKFELKKKFPEIIEEKKQAMIAETSAKTAQVQGEKSGVKKDKDFIIRQQIADIKDALMIMGIKTGIFKEKKEAEVNANTPLEQQVSGIRDTLNAMCIKMGLLEDRRKEQVPIGFPCRRLSNDE